MTEPSRIQRQLATELYTLRNLAGLSQRELRNLSAHRGKVVLSQTMVSRAERGDVVLDRLQTDTWLELVDADAGAQARVRAMTEAAHADTRSWADLLAEDQNLQEIASEADEQANRIRTFQPSVLPGLLQTAEYARRVLTHTHADPAGAAAARLRRQQILYRSGRSFEFLVDERLLSHPSFGRSVHAAQLHHLASMATLDSVDLAVLPVGHDAVIPYSGFVLRDPADGGPTYATIELLHGRVTLTDPGLVNIYELAWDQLRSSAVVDEDAVAMIRAVGDSAAIISSE